MEVFSFPLIPGHWYILITCEKCNTEHVLFPDLTQGKSTLIATHRSCPHEQSPISSCPQVLWTTANNDRFMQFLAVDTIEIVHTNGFCLKT